MHYTVQKLAKMAGISARTLRYYDEIGLLRPAKINESGYRIYGPKEVDTLQQILFYRELGFCLSQIKDILSAPGFDELKALQEHRRRLILERAKLDLLIANVEKTIKTKKGGIHMTDQEKFEGFKKKLIYDNEAKYGKEIREKYGDEAVDSSNKKIQNMTMQQYQQLTDLEAEFMATLYEAFKTGDPAGKPAQKAADLHRQWLCFYWDKYTKEAHAGLAKMYVEDDRFKAYYDKDQPGMAEFLKEAILIYTGQKSCE